jgi:hypothetical protein
MGPGVSVRLTNRAPHRNGIADDNHPVRINTINGSNTPAVILQPEYQYWLLVNFWTSCK